MHRSNLDVQEGLAGLSSQLQEAISGVSVVRSYAMEPAMAARFEAANEALFHGQLRLIKVNASMPAITMLLPAFAMWIVLWVGGTLIQDLTTHGIAHPQSAAALRDEQAHPISVQDGSRLAEIFGMMV